VCDDGHSTHVKNIDFVTRAKDNYIHVLILPPHISHHLQHLDFSFMFPLSTYYEQEVWLKNHSGKIVTIKQVDELFGLAYQRAGTIQTAVNSFKTTEICPYNPYIFPKDLFKPSETTNKTLVNKQQLIKHQQHHIRLSQLNMYPLPQKTYCLCLMLDIELLKKLQLQKEKKGKL